MLRYEDSLAREFVGYFMTTMGIPDTSKFEASDTHLNISNVRVTFQSWQDIIEGPRVRPLQGPPSSPDFYRKKSEIGKILNFYNLIHEHSSSEVGIADIKLVLKPIEEHAPSVFIMNPAMAYSLWRQSFKSYSKFVFDFVELMGGATQNMTKKYFYSNPFIHGTAHPGTDYITQSRNMLFSNFTRPRVEDVGFKYIATQEMTSCRPEESWDGLHYLRGTSRWNGHVSATIIQAVLNDIFGSCVGST